MLWSTIQATASTRRCVFLPANACDLWKRWSQPCVLRMVAPLRARMRERSRGRRGPGRVDGGQSARVSRQSGRVLPPAVKHYWLSSFINYSQTQQIPCFTEFVLRISNKNQCLFWNWVISYSIISTNPFQRQYYFLYSENM